MMDVTVVSHNSHHDPNALGIGHNDLSEPSSPESTFDESDLFSSTITDDVTAQLVAAGTVGVAAAAAIATGRKRKRPHIFETNPSIRKRQQTRLLRKLKNTIEEYTTRVGQQAVILTCMPGKPNQASLAFKVFGSQPLENTVRSCRVKIMQELETALAQQAPLIPEQNNHNLHELPPLQVDGIPTPLDKMTQAQLRAFIPEMLKFSTGRSKPGWGKPEYRPIWWPLDVPWANVRSDVRSEEMKKKVSWTHALKTIVRNCYKHHNREDLLPQFAEESHNGGLGLPQPHTMLQTISNPDGSLSIIQIDPGDANHPQIVTLSDGTQAQIVHAQIGQPQQPGSAGDGSLGPTMSVNPINIQEHGAGGVNAQLNAQLLASGVDLNNVQVAAYADATLNSDGQLVLSDTAGLNGVVSIPMSMYQTVVTNLPNLNAQNIQVLTSGNLTAEQQNCPNLLANLTSNTAGAATKLETDLITGSNAHNINTITLTGARVPKQEHDIELVHENASPIEVVTIDSSQMHHSHDGLEADSESES